MTCHFLITKFFNILGIYALWQKIKEEKMKKDKKGQNWHHHEDQLVEVEENEEENLPEVEEKPQDAKLDAAELERLKQENAKLADDYMRAYADLENTKKRCAAELEKNSKYAVGSFAKGLLSVADNLHRALAAAEETAENSGEQLAQLKKGVELTEAELMKVFAKFGISKMETIGQVFNPSFHQVIQEVEDKSKPAGTVVAELQTGYMINDRLLREAMVIVAR